MLDQLFKIIQQSGQETVVENPEIPNESNQEVMADATKTIASGFQNVLAGGGLQNILDLFKGGGSSSKSSGGGIASLLKNPMVTMMVGYFISKLVNKHKMTPAAASSVANNLIPSTLENLINKTNDPNDTNTTLDGLMNSITGSNDNDNNQSSPLQDILDRFTGGGNNQSDNSNGFDLQDLIGQFTNKAQTNMSNSGGGGLMDLIKGFIK